MRILLVDDNDEKSAAIRSFLEEIGVLEVEIQKSFRSGLEAMLYSDYDFILLDMSMPNYDIKPNESGGSSRPLAGRDILKWLKKKRRVLHVLIITQYEEFNGMSLSEIDKNLRLDFPDHYCGSVFYSTVQKQWKKEIEDYLIKEGVLAET